MPFDPIRIVTPNQDDQRVFPALDELGVPIWESGDTNAVAFPAIGVGSCQGAIGNERGHHDIDVDVYVTDARVIVVCERWAKGSRRRAAGFGGPIISSAIANRVSQHRADVRARGRYLVGQIRYPWVSGIAYQMREGRRTENTVRIITTHLTGFKDVEPVSLVLHLGKSMHPSSLAKEITRRVIADRVDYDKTTNHERDGLAAARWPTPAQMPAGTIPVIRLPGAYRANAASAYLGRNSSRSAPPLEGAMTLPPPAATTPIAAVAPLQPRPAPARTTAMSFPPPWPLPPPKPG